MPLNLSVPLSMSAAPRLPLRSFVSPRPHNPSGLSVSMQLDPYASHGLSVAMQPSFYNPQPPVWLYAAQLLRSPLASISMELGLYAPCGLCFYGAQLLCPPCGLSVPTSL